MHDVARSRSRRRGRFAVPLLCLLWGASLPSPAQARLQCVPYARALSGIAIHGNAALWWAKAEGRYRRGREPEIGAVLNFRPTAVMPLGHIAVVSEILDERRIVLDHANWSKPGLVERKALAVDVSEAGDWSTVRVWYGPANALGSRENPVFGFIYADPPVEDGAEENASRFAEGRPDNARSGPAASG